jgi:glucose/arabinose dehydrogenase
MKKSLKITGITGCALMLSCSGEFAQASNLGIDPTFQNQLRVTEFATGLDSPSGILQLNDGSMVIATTTGGQSFFSSQSKTQLVRLQDTNGNGIADRKTVLYDGAIAGNNLPGGISAIRAVDNYIFATNYNRQQISVFQQGADLSANSLTLKGSFDFSFPVNSAHTTNALAIRQTGSQQFELYFNVGAANPGSAGNNQATVPGSVSVKSGDFNLATTSLSGESLYKIPFTVGSSSLSFTQPVQVATGL